MKVTINIKDVDAIDRNIRALEAAENKVAVAHAIAIRSIINILKEIKRKYT